MYQYLPILLVDALSREATIISPFCLLALFSKAHGYKKETIEVIGCNAERDNMLKFLRKTLLQNVIGK